MGGDDGGGSGSGNNCSQTGGDWRWWCSGVLLTCSSTGVVEAVKAAVAVAMVA